MAAKMIPLSKIKDNPWRDKKRNPINPEQVERLAESIETTDEFWEGVYGREVEGGYVELAFGHHRLDAARAAGLKEIPITLRKLSDGDMLMRMARENMRGELPVMLEAVSAAVKAYGEGKVVLTQLDPSTRKDAIRYAPSFVSGKEPATPGVARPYTASTLARFLGSVYFKKSSGLAQNSVVASLAILEAEEMKIAGFSIASLRREERAVAKPENPEYNKQEDEVPVKQKVAEYKPAKEIIKLLSDVKKNYKTEQERRGKSAEEQAKIRQQQLELQEKTKAEEKKAEEDRKALLKKMADAQREENDRKADALKKQLKENDERAKQKEVLNKLRAKELEEKLEQKRLWEAQQRQQDLYQPLRRDVENFISRYEMKITERNPEREEVKALNRTLTGGIRLKPEDRARAQRAVRDYANWLYDWVLPQLAPELKAEQKRKAEAQKATQPKSKGKSGA